MAGFRDVVDVGYSWLFLSIIYDEIKKGIMVTHDTLLWLLNYAYN